MVELFPVDCRLRTGWSVKTAAVHQPVQQPLDEEEQAAILDVIKRAEQLEVVEQERVNKMVKNVVFNRML